MPSVWAAMGDPLSVTASIVTVLDVVKEVINFGLDVANAPKAILSLKKEVVYLRVLLEQLKDRCEETLHGQKTPPPWLQVLWEVRRSDKSGLGEYEYGGLVAQLKQAVDEAMANLQPRTGRIRRRIRGSLGITGRRSSRRSITPFKGV